MRFLLSLLLSLTLAHGQGIINPGGGGSSGVSADGVATIIESTDIAGQQDLINSQPHSAARVAAYTSGGGGTAAPLRILVLGDSIATGLDRSPNMKLAGVIGLGMRNTSGTVTQHTGPGDARFDYWTNGRAVTFATSSRAEFTVGGSATGDIQGDTVYVAYIAGSGRGSFDIETSPNGTDTWTKQGATVNTSNASTIGVATTRTISTTNNPYYRMRINNVTTASVTIIATGIYNSNGGGVIWMPVCNQSGTDISQAITTPSAVLTPIWTSLAPDAVLSAWADGGSEWADGGSFRAFYDTATAAFANTDWITISRNVAADETGFEEQQEEQRNWSLETQNTWVNGRNWTHDWTESLAKGYVTDDDADVHLSALGQIMRNYHVFSRVPLFQWSLGQVGGPHAILSSSVDGHLPMFRYAGTNNLDANFIETRHAIKTSGGGGAFILGNRSSTLASNLDWSLSAADNGANNTDLNFAHQGANRVRFNTQGIMLGTGISLSQVSNLTSGATLSVNNNVVRGDATSAAFTVTLPAASTVAGKIFWIRKIDSSGNAVTIDGNASETIDGATTKALSTQWASCALFCNGTSWDVLSN